MLHRCFNRGLQLKLGLRRLNRRDVLRMRDRRSCLAAGAVEIGDSVGRFRRRIAAELVADGAGETFLAVTAPTTSAPATTPAPALAAALLLATGGLLLAFLAVLLGVGILFAFAGRYDPSGEAGAPSSRASPSR